MKTRKHERYKRPENSVSNEQRYLHAAMLYLVVFVHSPGVDGDASCRTVIVT